MTYEQYLMHHGIRGQKWGERRFQYEDGSLTPEGRRRYGVKEYRRERANLIKEGRYQSESYKKLQSSGGNMSRKQIRAANAKIDREAKQYADRMLESKYGKQTIKELRAKDAQKKNAAATAAILATVGGVTAAAAIAGLTAQHLIDKKGLGMRKPNIKQYGDVIYTTLS